MNTMSLQEVVENMRKIQKNLLDYIENEDKIEENFQNLQKVFYDQKIQDDKYSFNSVLHLISNIAENHHRNSSFFEKIEKIIQFFKESIKTHFSSTQIFNVFKKNKRILLFLLKEEIIVIDKYIFKIITSEKYLKLNYPQYFQPEIKKYIENNGKNEIERKNPKEERNEEDNNGKNNNEEEEEENEDYVYYKNNYFNYKEKNSFCISMIQKELPENFEENRNIGENEDPICQLIRADSIENFIIFVNKNQYSLNSKVNQSIFETNRLLLDPKVIDQNSSNGFYFCYRMQKQHEITLIDYAAFFGAISIFNYLYKNGVKLSCSLWYCAIHGNNPEIINILEKENIKPSNDFNNSNDFKNCFKESIKCHNNDFADYFLREYLKEIELKSLFIFQIALKYYDFIFIDPFFIGQSTIEDLCKYDHTLFVNLLLKITYININQEIILFKLVYRVIHHFF